MAKIKAGIVGYGNLGKGVQLALEQNPALELVAIFTRRSPESLKIGDSNIKVENTKVAVSYQDKIDIMFLCGGSATDLPVQGPQFARLFNTVDSFDTHARIPEYYQKMDEIARENNNTSAISIGWDPGLFSLNRLLGEAILPGGKGYTFWGPGVSQGHSDAIRKIKGVKDAVQYTIPRKEVLNKVREGENPQLTSAEKHLRKCYVVVEEGMAKDKISRKIKNMPDYFADYRTEVNFVTESELKKKHYQIPHGGFVLHTTRTGNREENKQMVEFSLKLDSNPQFTASVLIAYGRAVYCLNQEKKYGAKTIFDIPPAYLSNRSGAELRKELL